MNIPTLTPTLRAYGPILQHLAAAGLGHARISPELFDSRLRATAFRYAIGLDDFSTLVGHKTLQQVILDIPEIRLSSSLASRALVATLGVVFQVLETKHVASVIEGTYLYPQTITRLRPLLRLA